MKILVVHRQSNIVEEIKSALDHYQPVVRYYQSGLDGLIASRMERFNLIMCSTDLPVITGFELVRSLKTISVNSTTPVVLLADELNDKVKHMGSLLGVTGLMRDKELEILPDLVKATV